MFKEKKKTRAAINMQTWAVLRVNNSFRNKGIIHWYSIVMLHLNAYLGSNKI